MFRIKNMLLKQHFCCDGLRSDSYCTPGTQLMLFISTCLVCDCVVTGRLIFSQHQVGLVLRKVFLACFPTAGSSSSFNEEQMEETEGPMSSEIRPSTRLVNPENHFLFQQVETSGRCEANLWHMTDVRRDILLSPTFIIYLKRKQCFCSFLWSEDETQQQLSCKTRSIRSVCGH